MSPNQGAGKKLDPRFVNDPKQIMTIFQECTFSIYVIVHWDLTEMEIKLQKVTLQM